MSKEIFDKLNTKIKGEIHFDEESLEKYSHDTSLFEIKPRAIIFPKTVLDIENLVHFVNDNKNDNPWLSLTPRSGGTDMSGGAIGEGLILDFTKNLNEFEIDEEAKIAKTQPGVFFRDFEKVTDQKNLEMPIFPASKNIAALGGMVSNNCGGEKSLRYGQIRNFVQSVKVVLSNGKEYKFKEIPLKEAKEIAKEDSFIGGVYKRMIQLVDENYQQIKDAKPKTSKNSSGYAIWDVYDKSKDTINLAQLFVGAQGTLGVVTETKLNLLPIKKHKKLVTVFLPSWEKLPKIVNDLRPVEPTSLETFDDTTMKLGMRFFPQIAKKTKTSLLHFALGFWPEIIMGIKLMRMPKLIILVEFEEDSEDILNQKVIETERRLKESKVVFRTIQDEKEAEKYFIIRRESFALLRKAVGDKKTAPFVDDFCVLPEVLPEFLPKFLEILEKYEIKANIAGHAGSGNLHIIPLMDLKKESERAKIQPCSDELYDLVIQYGGTITAEHNDGLIRTPYVEKMFGYDTYQIFKEIKNIFDPNNIFNPGKKVDGSKEYTFSHMKID
jgi:FAD/FMN-containing dehydrogenase